MIGNCNYIKENGFKCGSTTLLSEIYFRDPYIKSNRDFVELCHIHYKYLIKEMTETIITLARRRDNLYSQRNREKIIAKENDSFYSDLLTPKIDNLKNLLKKKMNNECRNMFCMNNLQKLGPDEKIFTVTTFTPMGKRHYTFNFCSLKCFTIMKGKCGIQRLVNTQSILEIPKALSVADSLGNY